MRLLKIIFLPALLFASYFFFTYVYSPSIITTGIGFKPTISPPIDSIKGQFVTGNNDSYGSIYPCSPDADSIESLFKEPVFDVENKIYYFKFSFNRNDKIQTAYIFKCDKIVWVKSSVDSTERTVIGRLGTLTSKAEFDEIVWLLDSIGVFNVPGTSRSVKSTEITDSGDDFVIIHSGIDTYGDIKNFKFYKNLFNQAFFYSKVNGQLSYEYVLDLFPSRK